jgi:O-antigen/teichoic acid export membrane protein
MTKINTLLACFSCWMLILLGDVFIRRWIGEGYSDAYLVLCLLAVGFGATLTFNPLSNAMYAIAKLKRPALLELVEAGVKFALSIALVREYGMYGVAFGTVIPLTFFALIARPWIACRELEMPLRRHYTAVLPLIALIAVLITATQFGVRPWLPVSYGTVLIVPLVALVPFLWLCANFFFDAGEKQLLIAQVPQPLRAMATAFCSHRPSTHNA